MFQYLELFYNNKTKYQNKNTTLSKLFQSSMIDWLIGVQSKHRRNRVKIDTLNTWPFTFLAWQRHLNIRVAGLSLCICTNLPTLVLVKWWGYPSVIRVTKTSTGIHNRGIIATIKNVPILRFLHYTFNHRDTEEELLCQVKIA